MKSDAHAVAVPSSHARPADFVALAKPRLNLLVVVSAVAGFVMAGGEAGNVVRVLCVALGTGLVAGGASAFNQILERVPDGLMQRTRTRPMPDGRVTTGEALLFASIMASSGLLVLTLGALLAEVPHTRPVRISGSASDPELAARLAVRPTRYEGPTGIVGVLNTACQEGGLASATVWANVPHYVSGIENPKAALALVRRVLTLLNLEADLGDLEEASRQYDQNLAEIVAQNAKIKAYVAKLESRDTEEAEAATPRDSDLPPASELVAEIEQFLRQQRPE